MASWEILFKLVLSVVCGGVVGYQREAADRPAGFRTHVLVAIGATLITMVSANGFKGADPTRIAAQIVTGIGFLGAGTIIRQGNVVKGLTTAASIWTIAGIGIGIGTGFYFASIVTTVLVFAILSTGKRMEAEFIPRIARKNLVVRGVDKPGQLGKIDLVFEKSGINIRNVSLEEEKQGESIVKLELALPAHAKMEEVKNQVLEVPGVIEVFWEEIL
jgi:putative Mg2+ transporter-C (MgtC) family protein